MKSSASSALLILEIAMTVGCGGSKSVNDLLIQYIFEVRFVPAVRWDMMN
ncbi:hypothetical protein [Eleftheria terrae]|nr:hypothetical protein [Eleftheria terrae]WKB53470.1 hypothetical protein N7L95_03470 [Eleftheria terrae]